MSKLVTTDFQYILPDEHPCQFCEMTLWNCCPYQKYDDAKKIGLCNHFFYFKVLREYEREKFGK